MWINTDVHHYGNKPHLLSTLYHYYNYLVAWRLFLSWHVYRMLRVNFVKLHFGYKYHIHLHSTNTTLSLLQLFSSHDSIPFTGDCFLLWHTQCSLILVLPIKNYGYKLTDTTFVFYCVISTKIGCMALIGDCYCRGIRECQWFWWSQ